MRARPYDVLIFGATGFTGGLVAEYFARHVPLQRTPWAIAGRCREKLQRLRQRLALIDPACAGVAIVEADAGDPDSTKAMVTATRVLITTVGPFVRFGEPVFAACAAHGTDYVDSTGEPAFVRAMHQRYDARALSSNAIMVSCCGLDSIPTDLGVYYTMRELAPSGPVTLTGHFSARARPSGGTWHSVLEALKDGGAATRAAPERPQAKNGRRVAAVRPRPTRDAELGWVLPLPTIDAEIVVRSAAALPMYGPDFTYSHALAVSRFSTVMALGLGGAAAALLAQASVTRHWLGSLLAPGAGPTAEERARSWFRIRFVARHAGRELVTEVSGGDPGYDETAKMLAEAALCLAEDRERLSAQAGVLTPAVAFGEPLITRLVRAGLVFRVVSG